MRRMDSMEILRKFRKINLAAHLLGDFFYSIAGKIWKFARAIFQKVEVLTNSERCGIICIMNFEEKFSNYDIEWELRLLVNLHKKEPQLSATKTVDITP